MAAPHTKIDLTPLKRVIDQIANAKSAHIRSCFRQWGKRYEAFIRRDFVQQSGGGGRWPDLEESTLRRRRQKGKGAMILRDTGTMLAALTIGSPGNHFKLTKTGCEFGFGGPARHPEGRASIADIARFHDSGEGQKHQRQIIVQPDSMTIAGMAQDVKNAVKRFK